MAEFFLLGQQEYRKTNNTKETYCPYCRSIQVCKEKELSLYLNFLWVVPLKKIAPLASYFKCSSCQQRFPQYAPDWENLSSRVAFEFLLLTCLVQTRMANGAFRRQEATKVRQHFLIFAHTVVEEAAVLERAVYMKKISKDNNNIQQDLIPMVVEKINDEQREHILRAMTHVALKEGSVNAREAKIVAKAGEIMGVEKEKIQEFLPKGYNL